LALAVPLSRFTSRVGGGSAFFVDMQSHSLRPAFFVAIFVSLFVVVFFFGPFLWYPFDIHRKMSNIRRHQDPEELRAWAGNLIAIYGATNYLGQVTNRPPSGIPASGHYPKVFVQRVPPDGPYHVVLLWGIGLANWGMDIGDTNFLSADDRKTEWKPGIYFVP